jgi:hypothetical protein
MPSKNTVLDKFNSTPDISTTREQESFDFLSLLGDLASKASKKGSAVIDFVANPREIALDEPTYDAQNRLVVKEPVQRKINFDNWFKDSKVVGKDGKPLIVYHSGDFDENLNPIFNDSLQGIHFGTKAAAYDRYRGKPTEDFVRNADVYYSDKEGGWVWDSDGQESLTSFGSEEMARQDLDSAALEVEAGREIDEDQFEQNTTKVFLSMQNPKYTNIDAGSDWSEVIEKAKKQGHDGIIYTNKYEDPGSKSYIIFDSKQAKSVKNKGGFDPENPDILSFKSIDDKDTISANEGGLMEATGDMTTQGREVFREGEVQYSEKTVTFQMKDGKWVTIPSVDKEGNEMPQEALEKFVEENGPVDPVTGAELPTFDSVEQATEYAVQRSQDLMPPMPTTPAEMYHGGLMGGEEGAGECGCASCQMKKMMNYVQEDMSSMFAPLSGMGMVGIDPVSGNEVPAGSGPDNVRDDIPAVLSDGEYVVPADVVRYHGLKHLEQMRQEAKMGLMAMMMEGQIQTIEEEEEAYSKSAMEGEQEVELSEEDAEDGEGYETYETPEGVEVDQPEVKVTSSGMMMFKPVKKLAFMRT